MTPTTAGRASACLADRSRAHPLRRTAVALVPQARSPPSATRSRGVPGGVRTQRRVNSLPPPVVLGREPLQEVRVARPGLVVVDIAAAADATAGALQAVVADQWATAAA